MRAVYSTLSTPEVVSAHSTLGNLVHNSFVILQGLKLPNKSSCSGSYSEGIIILFRCRRSCNGSGRYILTAEWNSAATRRGSNRMENTPPEKIREAHRKVMAANHPDAGGSHYLASKINEAKDMMIGKSKGSGSAF
ncbi:Mitochondrial import inner membrane translocase subunit TIM14-2 [Platanthera guangdongensis]|uniref:Mitochondrial import inner membrane translocase subunit TIM14-2 n=1 Tax=Platanthera guangdongensis TaxID=2320717 RepID=A0ABR2LVE6_9ASPA